DARGKRSGPSLTRERGEKDPSLMRQAPTGTVLFDYAHCRPEDWRPDGSSYGTGPLLAGAVRLAGDPAKPTITFAERSAAVYDRLWDGLAVAPGEENDPGSIGRMVRAGRTIRTPTFRLKEGKLFYLVRGAGMAYAPVGAHALIAGPLHGQLVVSIPDSK